MHTPLNIGFIGSGVVGKSLALALSAVGYNVTSCCSRTLSSAEALASMIPKCSVSQDAQELVNQCELVFITTPDDVIGNVVAKLSWSSGQGVVHCSGYGSLDLLSPAVTMGACCGSLHPLQTFASDCIDEENPLQRFCGITFGVESDGWLRDVLETMAVKLGGNVVWLNSSDKALYHAAAVMSCGHLVVLLKEASKIWKHLGFSEKECLDALIPLAKTTLENVSFMGLDRSMTGPIARGDSTTLQGHIKAFQTGLDDMLHLYLALSKASIPFNVKGSKDVDIQDMNDLIDRYISVPRG